MQQGLSRGATLQRQPPWATAQHSLGVRAARTCPSPKLAKTGKDWQLGLVLASALAQQGISASMPVWPGWAGGFQLGKPACLSAVKVTELLPQLAHGWVRLRASVRVHWRPCMRESTGGHAASGGQVHWRPCRRSSGAKARTARHHTPHRPCPPPPLQLVVRPGMRGTGLSLAVLAGRGS